MVIKSKSRKQVTKNINHKSLTTLKNVDFCIRKEIKEEVTVPALKNHMGKPHKQY